ncbi:MAG: hypothetical protein R8M46_02925 [Ghiorsea sp.]
MKNALKNPIFVGLMVLVAIWIVYIDVIAPLKTRGLLQAPAAMIQAFKENLQPVSKLKPSALNWPSEAAKRSPFAAPANETARLHRHTRKRKVTYQLSAILFGSEKPLALINGKTVAEGERIGTYTVLSIFRNYVILKGSKKQVKLYLSSQGGS